MNLTSLSNGTILRIRASRGDPQSLEKLLNPQTTRAGGRTVLTASEAILICEMIKFVVFRGFDIDYKTLQVKMAAAASENGCCGKGKL